jgi:macrolide-specific efflux system membrane fusion protein
VGSVTYVVGESSSGVSGTQAPGITLLPQGDLEVLANFAEADAARIQVGDPARVTFAALAGASSPGTVVAVDEVATTGANSLVTYGVRVRISDPPTGVREGMTASITVTVDEVADVLFLPPGVVTERDGEAFVLRLLADGTTEEVQVTLGLKGDLGTQIQSGLSPEDTVVVPEAEEGAVQFPQGGVPGRRN